MNEWLASGRVRLVGSTALACVCAASSFGSLYAGWAWLWPVMLTIVVIIATSEAVRRSPIPSALGPLVAAAAVVIVLTAVDAHSEARLGFLPGHAARHTLFKLLTNGANVVHSYAAPVPAQRGAVLLAVIGVAAVTLVVDLCALTLDRAALAAPPLLAIYVVAAVLTHHGVGWRPFLLTVAGLLVLLLADTSENRRRWGRRFSGPQDDPSVLGGSVGRQLSFTAIVVAVIVPVLLPGLHAGLPRHPSGGDGIGGSGGGGNVITLNPVVSLAADLHHESDEVLITYRTTSSAPGYLRLTALNQFNGTEFSASPLRSSTSRPVDSTTTLTDPPQKRDVRTDIRVGSLDEHWAPMPIDASGAAIAGNWLFDPASSTVWSTQTSTQDLQYVTHSHNREPTARQLSAVSFNDLDLLPPSLTSANSEIPSDLPPRVTALATQLERATPYDTALAIQKHFLTPPFTYTLAVPESDSTDALSNFLFTTHTGYCQQYAAAMTLLARIDGIPARVAVGFTAGVKQSDGTWVVTGADAHAWPELYFPGTGWVPFEPTPRTDGQTVAPTYANSAALAQSGVSALQKTAGKGGHTGGKTASHKNPAGHTRKPGTSAANKPASLAASANRIGLAFLIAVLVVLVVGLAIPSGVRLAARRRHSHPHSDAEAAHAAWDEVRDSTVDVGIDWPEGRTPNQTVATLLRHVPTLLPVREPLGRIALAEQQARYARSVDPTLRAELVHDVASIHRALFLHAGWATRMQAAILPRSSLIAIRRQWASRRRRLIGWRPRRRQPA